MKQKFSILRDTENNQLIIREYGELDKDILSLLCEETHADEAILEAIKAGKTALVSQLRTKNMYPPGVYAEKIAESVMALYESPDEGPTEIWFNDIDMLAAEQAENIEDVIEEDPDEIEDILEDDVSGNLEEKIKIKEVKSSLKIADDDGSEVVDDI